MNPNVGMANMNPMGGPVGGGAPVPMMNNGAMNPQAAAAAAAAAANANRQPPVNDNQRTHLNTYIYEYFIRYGMYDCARTLLNSDQQVNVQKDPGAKGNALNGAGDDPMDTDSKDDLDAKLPDDLPPPKLPMPASESSFLYEWFCLFWDIYNAQRHKGGNGTVNQYVAHTQQQSRLRQNQQQDLLRQMRPDMAAQHQYQAQMMRNMQNMNGAMGMNMKQNNLARAAMANNQNNPQMQMLQQQAKQNPMQRDPSNMDVNRGDRPSSPASGENAPSPSKRQRVEAPFNPNQAGAVMGNGRGQAMPGQPPANNVAQAHQILAMNGINPNSLNSQQFANFVNSGPAAQQKSIATYSQNLQQHHGSQMGNKQVPHAPGPQNQGSPMQQGPDGNMLNSYYNAGDMAGAAGMRPGGPGQQPPGSNHALQDYQMQLMLLEQQNKKRLMMARQEQDSMGVPREGGPGPSPGGPGQPLPTGPNGQPFPDTSPQAMRTGASPNPSEQMKRGTPQMNNSGIPSPVPEGGQSRGSPNSAMNFMGNHVDPKMAPHFFNGVDGNNMAVAQAQMNGMRPPGAHPGQPFNGQMNPQQMMAARQGQPQGPNGQQWQQGPNGQMAPQGMQPGAPNQVQGTPQQRSMPPPSAPAAAAAAAAGRTTASPQQAAAAPPTPNQGNKAAPKKKESKAAKEKRAANKKSNQNLNNANATPASEAAGDADPAAPATPITPANPGFNKGGAAQSTGTAVSAVPAPAPVPPQGGADPNQNNGLLESFPQMDSVDLVNLEFANPLNSSGDVLNDFDFDSFLHDGDAGNEPFDFNGAFVDGSEIPAE